TRLGNDDPARFKVPGHRARLAERAAAAGQRGPNVGYGSISVVGRGLDEQRGATWPIAFVDHLDQRRAFATARAALDRPLDGVHGHVGFTGTIDGHPQACVTGWIRATFARGDGDLTAKLGEQLTALDIVGAL